MLVTYGSWGNSSLLLFYFNVVLCYTSWCYSHLYNKDLKTWSIGRVESHEGRSYVVATEEGRLVSHNRVHLRRTNVSFGMPTTSPNKSLVPRLDMPIKPLNINNQTGQPTIKTKPKAKQSSPYLHHQWVNSEQDQVDW